MLYTDHAKYEEGSKSNHHTQPLYFLNLLFIHSAIYISAKHYAYFIKTFFQKPKRMQTITSLNNASKAAARSLWIRTHSRHLECELLLDDRLVHLPDRSQVFGAVAGDCVYKASIDLFKFCQKHRGLGYVTHRGQALVGTLVVNVGKL